MNINILGNIKTLMNNALTKEVLSELVGYQESVLEVLESDYDLNSENSLTDLLNILNAGYDLLTIISIPSNLAREELLFATIDVINCCLDVIYSHVVQHGDTFSSQFTTTNLGLLLIQLICILPQCPSCSDEMTQMLVSLSTQLWTCIRYLSLLSSGRHQLLSKATGNDCFSLLIHHFLQEEQEEEEEKEKESSSQRSSRLVMVGCILELVQTLHKSSDPAIPRPTLIELIPALLRTVTIIAKDYDQNQTPEEGDREGYLTVLRLACETTALALRTTDRILHTHLSQPGHELMVLSRCDTALKRLLDHVDSVSWVSQEKDSDPPVRQVRQLLAFLRPQIRVALAIITSTSSPGDGPRTDRTDPLVILLGPLTPRVFFRDYHEHKAFVLQNKASLSSLNSHGFVKSEQVFEGLGAQGEEAVEEETKRRSRVFEWSLREFDIYRTDDPSPSGIGSGSRDGKEEKLEWPGDVTARTGQAY